MEIGIEERMVASWSDVSFHRAPGSRGLIKDCQGLGKPWVHVQAGPTTPQHIAEFIRESRITRLMIAGNRESRHQGIGERVKRFLIVVFKSLATTPRPPGQAAPGVAIGIDVEDQGGPGHGRAGGAYRRPAWR